MDWTSSDMEEDYDMKLLPGAGLKKSLFSTPPPPQVVASADYSIESPQMCAMSVSPCSPCFYDSPFSLFKVKKLTTSKDKNIDSAGTGSCCTLKTPSPRRKPFAQIDPNQVRNNQRKRASPSFVRKAVQSSVLNPDLIGDFSQNCSLPVITGKHNDLQTITPETVMKLLREKQDHCLIIDCRYPYEYFGGHVQSAVNIYMKEQAGKFFFQDDIQVKKGSIVIFYCEFSSKRGPGMYRYVRNKDRDVNTDSYPALFYPEMYIMEGGYESFFNLFKGYCDPPEYKKMLDENSSEELSLYRRLCKASKTVRRKCKARSGLKF